MGIGDKKTGQIRFCIRFKVLSSLLIDLRSDIMLYLKEAGLKEAVTSGPRSPEADKFRGPLRGIPEMLYSGKTALL